MIKFLKTKNPNCGQNISICLCILLCSSDYIMSHNKIRPWRLVSEDSLNLLNDRSELRVSTEFAILDRVVFRRLIAHQHFPKQFRVLQVLPP